MGTWEHGKLREFPWDNALGGGGGGDPAKYTQKSKGSRLC